MSTTVQGSQTTEYAVGQRVLIVDDEAVVCDVVRRYLELERYEVAVASDGAEALHVARSWRPDLMVLDLMLPGTDGLQVCRTIRAESSMPIIMLTARGEEIDRIIGLELGADDYVTKPFSPRELVARIKAVFRRVSSPAGTVVGPTLRYGGLVLNGAGRSATIDGVPVDLTAKEFDLLLFLASHPGQVFSRDQLMDSVWDYGYAGDTSTVTVHVRRLREKVEADPARPRYLKTVWGVGYKFEAPP